MPLQFHPVFLWLSIISSVALLGYLVWLYVSALRAKPRFVQADVVFQEWFASGNSQKNFFTKIGGARNCLRLVVTGSFLWVTSWFPFSLFAPFYDMEHVIPLGSITSVRHSLLFGKPTVLLTFVANNGVSRSLRLAPKNPEDFCKSLGIKIDNEEVV